MQVKRFVAADMRRALELVRQELGPDAIILSSNRTADGIELLTTMGSDSELLQLQQQPLGKMSLASASPMISDDAWSPMVAEREARNHFSAPAVQAPAIKTQANPGKSGRQLADDIEQARARMLANRKAEESAKEFLVGKNTKVNAGIPRYAGVLKEESRYAGAVKEESRFAPTKPSAFAQQQSRPVPSFHAEPRFNDDSAYDNEEPRFSAPIKQELRSKEDSRKGAIADRARSATAINPLRDKEELKPGAGKQYQDHPGAIADRARSATAVNPTRSDVRTLGQDFLKQESSFRAEPPAAKKANPMRPASSQVTIPPRRVPVPRPVLAEKKPAVEAEKKAAVVAEKKPAIATKPKHEMTAAERYPLVDDEPAAMPEPELRQPESSVEFNRQAFVVEAPAARFIITAESDLTPDSAAGPEVLDVSLPSAETNEVAQAVALSPSSDVAVDADKLALHNNKYFLDIQSEIAGMRSLIEQQFSRLQEVAPVLASNAIAVVPASEVAVPCAVDVTSLAAAPVVRPEVSVAATDAVVTVAEAPVIIVEAPVVVVEAPVVAEAPVVVVEAPVVAEAPVVVVEAPVVAEAPVVVVEAPVIVEASVVIPEAPVATTETSAVMVDAPVITTEVVTTATETLTTIIEASAAIAEVPAKTAATSTKTAEAPTKTAEAPTKTAEASIKTAEAPALTVTEDVISAAVDVPALTSVAVLETESPELTAELTLEIPEWMAAIPTLTAEVDISELAGISLQGSALAASIKAAEEGVVVADNSEHLLELQSEIADMRFALEQQINLLTEGNAPMTSSSILGTVSRRLERAGLPEDVISKVISSCRKTESLNEAWPEAMAILARQLPVMGRDIVDEGGVFAFVGPTGVGKTTTIGKLAARYVLKHGAGKVALITTDTYRIASHEQLRSIARILKVPVKVVDENNSLESLLKSLSHCEVVLIDTAGFRHGDPQLKAQLATFSGLPQVKTFVVLSTNCQAQMLKASVHAHGEARLQGCVLTKLDETSSLGEALGVVIKGWLPVAYTTNGQDIPKDLDVARGHQLVTTAIAMIKKNPVSAVS